MEIIERAFYTSKESDWGLSLYRICHTTTKRTTNTGKKEKLAPKIMHENDVPQSIKYWADQ